MLQVRGNDSLLLWGATAVVITVIIGMWQHRRKRNSIPTKWREVGTLSDMQMYPIKSGTAMVLKEALCTQYGLQTMGDVSPVLRDRIWNDVKITALDCGDEIAAWLSKYILNLDNGLRLGHSIPESMPLRSVADKHRPLKYLRDIDTGAYPDVSSYMLMAQSSIDDLQTRVPPHIKVSHRQFRPNFVVKGSQPYEEDKWQWIKIGETATFRAVKPCTRCFMVYGDKSGEFKTARTYSHMVSIKLIPDGEGCITLSAPKMPDIKVKIPNISEKCKIRQCMILNKVKISALDCGDEIASWLSKYILDSDTGCRLGYYVPDAMPLRAVAEKYKPLMNYREIDTGAYPDLSSYNLMTQSSVEDLQTKVPPNVKVTHRQFRPNFLVTGTEPYAEDNWKWVRIGETAVFRAVKPCTRYRVPDDPVMVKIKDRDPVLGMHYGIHKHGIVRVGDKIYVGESQSTRVF
ncbi:hypothetical protein C0J52_12382 [Blattella germanica]|nr:hypothetical protein C0J52_12382 [Blattella germanica]